MKIGFAREVGDRVLIMNESMIVEKGTPGDIFFHAKHERTKLFLGKVL